MPEDKPKRGANARKQNVQTSVTTYDSEGRPVKTVSRTPLEEESKPVEATGESKEYYANKYGFYKEILDKYPELNQLMLSAIEAYKADGKGWTDQRFMDEYDRTQFASERQKAEEEFDLAIEGPNADTYLKKVDDQAAALRQSAARLGVPLTEDQIAAQARQIVRSNLSQSEVDAFFSGEYMRLTTDTQAAEIAGKPLTGTASIIQDQLATAAYNYGLTLDNKILQQKTGEALGQGERWQEWLQGQEEFFREQAKLMYPGASSLLDRYSLRQVAEPYLNEAANLLGVSVESMDLADTKWTGFLSGPNGIMSKDEWLRVVKTDPKYGWDKSTKARQEYTEIGDELLSAFGMA